MAYTLNTDDARAVDLLLDRDGGGERNGQSNVSLTHATSAARGLQRHIAAAARVLDLLYELPAPAPPPGLAARCVRSIARAHRRANAVATKAPRPSAPAPPAC